MKLCFLGKSHAAVTLAEAARRKGFEITVEVPLASLVFVSEDTPTDETGVRDVSPIKALVESVMYRATAPIIITSQVTPGFTRSFKAASIYHQAETLRIEDAMQRALYPEMLIVGCWKATDAIRPEYLQYLEAFDAPVMKMSYEDAEFTKMAINAVLISQVSTSGVLSNLAKEMGADWNRVSRALHHDSRIGKYAYLHPGKWDNSRHLLRDYVSLLAAAPDNELLLAWRG